MVRVEADKFGLQLMMFSAAATIKKLRSETRKEEKHE
jgi:hypothetical protein